MVRMDRIAARALAPATALLLWPAPQAAGQGIVGRVVLGPTRAPVPYAVVAMADDSARIVAAAQTDSTGEFALAAARPGAYRILFFRAGGATAITPAVRLDSVATYVQHLFQIVDDRASGGGRPLFRASDVDRRATIDFAVSPMLGYSRGRHAARAVHGRVRVLFIVDERGEPEPGSVRVLGATDDAFFKPVRDAVLRWRMRPAERDGRAVPQLMEFTFEFGCPDPAPGGGVVRLVSLSCGR
jgi:hypothetical protein